MILSWNDVFSIDYFDLEVSIKSRDLESDSSVAKFIRFWREGLLSDVRGLAADDRFEPELN